MALVAWNPSFEIDIEIIDEQHKILVGMINDLYEAMQTGKDKGFLGKLISRMITYAAFHFAREEDYFAKYDYPETDRHVAAHNEFENKVTAFESNFKAGKQDLSMEIIHFLSEWLLNHIKGSDSKYGPFLAAKGVT